MLLSIGLILIRAVLLWWLLNEHSYFNLAFGSLCVCNVYYSVFIGSPPGGLFADSDLPLILQVSSYGSGTPEQQAQTRTSRKNTRSENERNENERNGILKRQRRKNANFICLQCVVFSHFFFQKNNSFSLRVFCQCQFMRSRTKCAYQVH